MDASLLAAIRSGTKLNKVVTRDASAPVIPGSGKAETSAATSSNPMMDAILKQRSQMKKAPLSSSSAMTSAPKPAVTQSFSPSKPQFQVSKPVPSNLPKPTSAMPKPSSVPIVKPSPNIVAKPVAAVTNDKVLGAEKILKTLIKSIMNRESIDENLYNTQLDSL